MRQKISFILLLFLFLCGNPLSADVSSPAAKTTEITFVGLSTDDLIARKGSPNAVAVFPTGDSVWTYKLLKTDMADCSDLAIESSGNENSKIAWIETEIFVIDSSHTITGYTVSSD